jgi:hypothetical protein
LEGADLAHNRFVPKQAMGLHRGRRGGIAGADGRLHSVAVLEVLEDEAFLARVEVPSVNDYAHDLFHGFREVSIYYHFCIFGSWLGTIGASGRGPRWPSALSSRGNCPSKLFRQITTFILIPKAANGEDTGENLASIFCRTNPFSSKTLAPFLRRILLQSAHDSSKIQHRYAFSSSLLFALNNFRQRCFSRVAQPNTIVI